MPKAKVDFMTTPGGGLGPALVSVAHDEPGDDEGTTILLNGADFDGNVIAVCRCGMTGSPNGTCDGSHEKSERSTDRT